MAECVPKSAHISRFPSKTKTRLLRSKSSLLPLCRPKLDYYETDD